MDEVLAAKAATIARCCTRAREEYDKDPASFGGDPTRQDAATMNLIRAWEAAVEMGDYVIGQAQLGAPADERAVITLLASHGLVAADLAADLKRIGEFCRAEWDYQAAPLPALVTILQRDLGALRACAAALLARSSP